jgi:myo-inositol 2-dehydrogenase/D-chiro-inositol 1-dehydrogenase
MKAARRVGLGLVGCGMGALNLYAPYFRYLEQGELVAVMDVERPRAEAVRSRSGARRVYSDLEALLSDAEVQAVMILTPTNTHVQQVVAAARAGKHVYCEKPMAVTVAEADEMITACRTAGVKLQVAFMKRFNPSFRLVKGVLQEGRLGELFEMRAVWDNCRFGASGANYRHRLASGGGFLQEDGSHPLDIIRWWMGEAVEVTGDLLIVDAERVENEDVGMVMMRHRSGALSSLHISMRTHRTGEESYELFGTKGTLLMRWLYHSTHSMEPAIVQIHELGRRTTDLTLLTSWSVEEEMASNWQYLNELRHFCDCVLENREPDVGGEEGRAVVEMINAAYLSAWRGTRVKLPLQEIPELAELFKRLRASSSWTVEADNSRDWRY